MVRRWPLLLALAGGCSEEMPGGDAIPDPRAAVKREASDDARRDAIATPRAEATPPPEAAAAAIPADEGACQGVLQRSLDGTSEQCWPPGFTPVEGALRTPITPEDEARAEVFEGFFDVDRVRGGKRLQGSWLEVKGGERYILSYQPMPEHFDKVERRVIVRAVPYSPGGQHLYARHLRVVSMTLAEGEAPRDAPTATLPPAQVVRTSGELRRQIGRWAQVVGTLSKISKEDSSGRAKILLRLDDGGRVTISEARATAEWAYRPRVGTRVTILGKLNRDKDGFHLWSTHVCDGEVATCSVGEDPLAGIYREVALATSTGARDPSAAAPPSEDPMPTPPTVEVPPASAASDPLEALALRCDGRAIAAAFAGSDLTQLAQGDAGPSVRLLARWEAARAFDDAGALRPDALASIAAALEAELGQPPPAWWLDHLGAAHLRPGASAGPPYYDVGLRAGGDRRGDLVKGPGNLSVRPKDAALLSASDGELYYDLSAGRLGLGPLPEGPGATLEIGRAPAGSTVYYATFERGSGGFRFPLHAVELGGERWRAEVCGPDRQILGGQGYLSVEIVVLGVPAPAASPGVMRPPPKSTGIAVFTAESHGVALDFFDPKSGARTLAWSSDLWFTR